MKYHLEYITQDEYFFIIDVFFLLKVIIILFLKWIAFQDHQGVVLKNGTQDGDCWTNIGEYQSEINVIIKTHH